MTVLQRLASDHELKLQDAVLVVKADDGKVTVVETIDPQPGRSALSGAMWTGLLGIVVGGPVGWVVGMAVGAGAGAAAAKVIDLGISDEWVDWFREAVEPGTATVAMLATEVDTDSLLTEAARFKGAQLVYANLDPATLNELSGALGEPMHPSDDEVVARTGWTNGPDTVGPAPSDDTDG